MCKSGGGGIPGGTATPTIPVVSGVGLVPQPTGRCRRHGNGFRRVLPGCQRARSAVLRHDTPPLRRSWGGPDGSDPFRNRRRCRSLSHPRTEQPLRQLRAARQWSRRVGRRWSRHSFAQTGSRYSFAQTFRYFAQTFAELRRIDEHASSSWLALALPKRWPTPRCRAQSRSSMQSSGLNQGP
jgi:hypothetical protein